MELILDSIVPVFSLIVLGAILRRAGWVRDDFFRTSDRLVYFILFPAMLFWKTGGRQGTDVIDWSSCLAAICAVLTMYLLSLLWIRVAGIPRFQGGAFSQCCYRFNTYVGMAVVLGALGDDGVRQFAVIISVAIPMINVLAVLALIWFAQDEENPGIGFQTILKSLVSNPLILACVNGLLYSGLGLPMPSFAANTFRLMAWASLPLALLSIGGSLTFSKVKEHLSTAMTSVLFKLLLLPAIGYGYLYAFGVPDAAKEVAMVFFALPTSTAIYILSAQLKSDVNLASATIVLSTLCSFISLSAVLLGFGH